FYLPSSVSGNVITWSANTTRFVLGGTDGDQLQRIEGGTTKVIAQNITTLGFTRQPGSPDIIEVALQAQKNTIKGTSITADLTFEIQMRN
ncbi:MAG TPA: hypothetical protein PKV41_04440, partial [Candidatus Omnitrophota bacterium]|nr:hypothetical protein [Candidatus Omnitrophota bacterium]